MASVSIRHVILGAASREERAGSDREVWRAPGNAISQEALTSTAERRAERLKAPRELLER